MSFAPRRISLALAAVALLVCRTASAQSAVYVTGAAFADIERFGSANAIGYSVSGDSLSLDSTAAGGGIRVGTFLHPKWSLELAIDDEATTKVKLHNQYSILAIYPPPRVRIPDTTASTRFFTVSTAIGFHPATRGRVKPGYFAGFTLIRATYKSDYFNTIVPLATAVSVSLGGDAPFPIPVPLPVRSTVKDTQNTSGAVLGFELALEMTKHLSVVPEIRALTFSSRGDGVFLIRPGVGARWSF
jgi:hypothetical protein